MLLISFLLKLIYYPLVAYGLLLSASALYRYLRTRTWLVKNNLCCSHVLTGLIVVSAVFFMAGGFPLTISASQPGTIVAFLAYVFVLFIGGRDIYRRRKALINWATKKFFVATPPPVQVLIDPPAESSDR